MIRVLERVIYSLDLLEMNSILKVKVPSVWNSQHGTRETKTTHFSLRTISFLHCRSIQVDRKTIKAQIWDTAGQERYRAITSA